MTAHTIPVGFMPLVDAAPLIVAQEMGFAAEQGLALDLHRAPSWSSLRDMLAYGHVDAAQMLAPMPVAAAMGLGTPGTPLSVLSMLSVNGNVIGVSQALADDLARNGHDFGFNDAQAAGRALMATDTDRLRIGVPFPFSMHAELLLYWLEALGMPSDRTPEIRTVPPPLMADALRTGEIDAFCVGEPWGSIVVEQGLGALLLPCAAIWAFAPEKVLAVRTDWVQAHRAVSESLIRSVWHAGRWLSSPESRILAAEVLSHAAYLDLPPEIIDRALSGMLTVTPQGLQRQVHGFVEFHAGAAGFPWRSQAGWIAARLSQRTGLNRAISIEQGAGLFRSDLYRAALAGIGADLPSASSKIEGSLMANSPASSLTGGLVLQRDSFFDGRIFDPEAAI